MSRKKIERMLTQNLLRRYENPDVDVPAPLRAPPNQIVFTALERDRNHDAASAFTELGRQAATPMLDAEVSGPGLAPALTSGEEPVSPGAFAGQDLMEQLKGL